MARIKRYSAFGALQEFQRLEQKLDKSVLTPTEIIQIQSKMIALLKGYLISLHPGTKSLPPREAARAWVEVIKEYGQLSEHE